MALYQLGITLGWGLRLVTFGSGGGTRIPGIAERLLEEAPDVCVHTEYRTRPGERLEAALGDWVWVGGPSECDCRYLGERPYDRLSKWS